MRHRQLALAAAGTGIAAIAHVLDVVGGAAALLIVATTGLAAWLAPTTVRNNPTGRSTESTELLQVIEGIAEAIAFPVLVIDQQEIIRVANRPARELFAADLAGAPFAAAIRDPGVQAAVGEALRSGATGEISFDLARNTERYLRSFVRPIKLEGVAAIVLIEDETRTLRFLDLQRDFVANASHELRTPLATVAGCAETLRGHARSDPEATERFTAIMLRETGRMRAIVEDLLSLNRIETNEHMRLTDRIDIVAIAREAISQRAAPDNRSPDFEGPDSLEIPGDRSELLHAIDNLLANADRHGGGVRRVRLIERENRVGIAVEDDGPGIERQHIPRLTERFYRIESPTGTPPVGTGLGLAIVKHVVSHHRGTLEIDSEPGRGSRFVIWLPASET